LASLSTTTPKKKGKPLTRKAIKPRGFNPDLIEAGLSELLRLIVFRQGPGDTARPEFQKIQVNLRDPLRIIADNDGHVITSVIIQSL